MFGLGNLGEMMGKMREMQAQMQAVKEKLDTIQVSAEAGAGMVRVTATAARRIIKIDIDQALLAQADSEMIADLITAAVNRALEQADEKAKAEMASVTNGMLPPGFDLSKLGL